MIMNMTQEERQLLLQDLYARLPCGVKGIITYNGDKDIFTVKGIFKVLFLSDAECCNVEDFKPYLRPMSSMTEEEKKEFNSLISGVEERCINAYGKGGYTLAFIEVNDWLNAHHFDYRGLIEKGLAIEAPKEMYD